MKIKQLQFGGYQIEIDTQKTAASYAKISQSGSEDCGCDYCKNFQASLPKALPMDVREFFTQAGIDIFKDAAVMYFDEEQPKQHRYGGEYYFWGKVLSGPKEGVDINEHFSFVLTAPSALVPGEFYAKDVLCFSFSALVPWVLE